MLVVRSDVLLSSVIYLSSYSHAACWSWEQGQQMLHKGSGGDAGVHANHHVMMSSSRFYHPSAQACPCAATW